MITQIPKYILILLTLLTLGLMSMPAMAQINFNDDDKDGLSNYLEANLSNTDPQLFDSDGDGYGDGAEWYFKSTGGDPLDANKYPRTLTVEEDADGDGFVDLGFNPNQFISLQLGSVITASNVGEGKCNLNQVDRTQSQFVSLDCSYKLIGGNNNEYYLGFQLYNAALELTSEKYSTDCYVDNNRSVDATLVCPNVPYTDAVLNTQNVILTNTPYFPTNRKVLSDKISIDVVELGNDYQSKIMDQTLDISTPKSCNSVFAGENTTCTFQLPALTTLPENYELGIGTKPSGACEANQNGLVTCQDVPTGNSTLRTIVLSNLVSNSGMPTGSKIQLKQFIPDPAPLLELTLATNQAIPAISGLGTKYNGPAILYFEGDGKKNAGRLENGVFTPVDLESLTQFPTETTVKASIVPELIAGNSPAVYANLVIKFINTPTKQPSIIAAKIQNLTRTGGANLSWVAGILMFLAINTLIFIKKLKY